MATHGTLKRLRPFLKANTDSQLLATDDVRPEDRADDEEDSEEEDGTEEEEEVRVRVRGNSCREPQNFRGSARKPRS